MLAPAAAIPQRPRVKPEHWAVRTDILSPYCSMSRPSVHLFATKPKLRTEIRFAAWTALSSSPSSVCSGLRSSS